MMKTQIQEAGSIIEQTNTLFLLPLFSHLIPKISQLRGQYFDQVLRSIQLAM